MEIGDNYNYKYTYGERVVNHLGRTGTVIYSRPAWTWGTSYEIPKIKWDDGEVEWRDDVRIKSL